MKWTKLFKIFKKRNPPSSQNGQKGKGGVPIAFGTGNICINGDDPDYEKKVKAALLEWNRRNIH